MKEIVKKKDNNEKIGIILMCLFLILALYIGFGILYFWEYGIPAKYTNIHPYEIGDCPYKIYLGRDNYPFCCQENGENYTFDDFFEKCELDESLRNSWYRHYGKIEKFFGGDGKLNP